MILGNFPKNWGNPLILLKKLSFLSQKTKNKFRPNFFCDFSAILRSFARDFRDFWGVFWLKIFVIFGLKSRDFQEKSSANTVAGSPMSVRLHRCNRQFADVIATARSQLTGVECVVQQTIQLNLTEKVSIPETEIANE